MEADPAWITICNRLMCKFDQEMNGEMRKNYYASATPFTLGGIVLKPANLGINWWPERESTLPNFYGLISKIYRKGNRKGNIGLLMAKNLSRTFFHFNLIRYLGRHQYHLLRLFEFTS